MYNRRQFIRRSALVGAAVLASPYVARAAGRVLRLGSVSNEISPNGVGAAALASEIKRLTGGSLTVQVFHAGALGKAGDLLTGIADGTIDMLVLATDTMANVPKGVLGLTTPFLFKDRIAARAAMDGSFGTYGAEQLLSAGIRTLSWGENGVRQTTAKKPVRTPEDLAGLRIRVPESPVSVAAFTALGAQPIALPFAELIPKLQAGEVDAQENPVGNIVTAKMEGLQTHISMTNHIYSPAVYAISDLVADELSGEENAALLEAARTASKTARDFNDKVDVDGLANMKAAGWTVVEDVDHASFTARGDAIAAAVAEVLGDDVVTKIKSIVS